MNQRKWQIRKVNRGCLKHLAGSLCSPISIARVLMNRGIITPNQAQSFLDPDLSSLDNLRSLPDLRKAVLLIDAIIKGNGKILIFGDYDADGLTACAILFLFLKKITPYVETYIPSRFHEGYGLSEKAVENIIKMNPDLVITVDSGIKDIKGVSILKNKGIKIIITDHHVPHPEERPDADVLVSTWDWNDKKIILPLSGAGVALALAHEYAIYRGMTLSPIEEFISLACVGTVGDVVPLLDENRVIVKYGLKKINQNPGCGLQALIEVVGFSNKDIQSEQIGYIIAPRLNAAGRVEDPRAAFELLISDNYHDALQQAKLLNEYNQKRQKEETKVFSSLIEDKNNQEAMKDEIVVVSGKNWSTGVLGIIASRLSERLLRPVIVLSENDSVAVGSARSILGFNITDSLEKVSSLLIRYGGHEMAAGLKISLDNLDTFRQRLNELFSERVKMLKEKNGIVVDAQVTMADVDSQFMLWLKKLEPFGEKNPNPLFVSSDVIVNERWYSGKNRQRLELVLMQNNKMRQHRIDAMIRSENVSDLASSSLIDLIFEVRKGYWDQPYLKIMDWRIKK
ncbi:single-stranded-DNA-specific exonuclease RecJ [Atribacter laminatus]|uniref:Single-stranded-DNA-specific exonuclease RecJ n=1 Tax=Atribacter laminatus TaxID=2847778 RepID=A0A7T1AMN4_ATRLM|nr:single-stranded-DNA-specific exonuclease RecJ [Atribacter laminatus]QPM68736.1 Single-stranded-DNA-specific exonuclease RecJ [Atribacter laminatus]